MKYSAFGSPILFKSSKACAAGAINVSPVMMTARNLILMAAARATPQHAGDILREQERSNSANVGLGPRPFSPPEHAVVRAGLVTLAWPFLLMQTHSLK